MKLTTSDRDNSDQGLNTGSSGDNDIEGLSTSNRGNNDVEGLSTSKRGTMMLNTTYMGNHDVEGLSTCNRVNNDIETVSLGNRGSSSGFIGSLSNENVLVDGMSMYMNNIPDREMYFSGNDVELSNGDNKTELLSSCTSDVWLAETGITPCHRG